jgi:DNA-binding CsgD family transcriptional regulator
VRGLFDGDADSLLKSVDALRHSSRPVEMAFALEDAGVSLTEEGRASDAASLLEEAVRIYERVGAAQLVSRCEAALRAAGVRRGRRGKRAQATTGWASLTKTERDVVALVSQGLTNREVGARLFISRRTVETHLSHVFAKLGLGSRVELAAEAARRAS